MGPDPFRRAVVIFGELRTRPPDEQTRLARERCGSDEVLRALVLELLEGDRLDVPGLGLPAARHMTPLAPEPVPERIGPHRIVREIGRGGEGIVYEAEQDVTHRAVALKVIGAPWINDTNRRRFQEQVEILGRLEHPRIARLYEGGVARGPGGERPYFVMELVEGLPLTKHAQDRGLGTVERVRLLIEVCEAVEYAHAHRVIHCDLKPSNILVNSSGRPMVLDFGIARLLAHDSAPAATTVVGAGTPGFMCPEQERGEEPHTRWDVFALGMLGSELLAGRDPAAEGLPTEAREVRIPGRHLGKGLEAVLRKASAREVEHRYGSVTELKDELARCLAHRSPRALESSLRDRFELFAWRNRRFAPLLVFVAAGAAALWWQASRAVRAVDDAHRQEGKKEAAVEFVDEVLGLADPANARGRPIEMDEVLASSEELAARVLKDEPDLQALVRYRLGNAHAARGNLEAAERNLLPAWERLKEELGPSSPRALEAALDVGSLRSAQGRSEESIALLEQTRETCLSALGPLDRLTLRAEYELGCSFLFAGDWARAERHLQDAYDARRTTLGEDHLDTLVGLGMIGVLRSEQHRLAEAEEILERTLARMNATLGETHPLALSTLNNLSTVHADRGEYETALELSWKELELREKVSGSEHPDTLMSRANVATLMGYTGNAEEAEGLLRELLEVCGRTVGVDHPLELHVRHNLAEILEIRGALEDAEQEGRRALDGRRRVLGKAHPHTLHTVRNLGIVLNREGHHEAALEEYRRALEDMKALPEVDALWRPLFLNEIAQCCLELELDDEARAALQEAQTLAPSERGPEGDQRPRTEQLLRRVHGLK